LLFPGILLLIVVLGISLVVYARNDRRNTDKGAVPQISDHIHMALGINVCGEWLEDLPEFESAIGIHSHGDGVMHIHPFSELGVGANAVFERYMADARDGGLDFELTGSRLDYLDETYKEGSTTCDGVEDPKFRLAFWEDVQQGDADPEVISGDFGKRRLDTDGGGLTLYFGDPKADIPRPPKADKLDELGAADGGQTPDASGNTTTTEPTDVTTPSTAGEPADGASTSTSEATATTATSAP
jgi:hypothetical protein